MIKINKFVIDNFRQPFVIAEIGSNHNGDKRLAKKMIKAARDAGCHCVKFQSWVKESLFSRSVYKNNKKLEKEIDDHTLELRVYKELKDYADSLGILFSASVFNKEEADYFVDELKIPFIKIASMDVNHEPFLTYLAKKKRPIFLSTGFATLSEISRAVELISTYNQKIVLLHCVSLYPADNEIIQLHNLKMLRDNFACPVGYSDHTLGTSIPLAAVSLGAAVIEKHFTLDKKIKIWDQDFAGDPAEMKYIVEESQKITKALGSFQKKLSPQEVEMKRKFQRSIVAARDLPKDQVLTEGDLEYKRPATGIPPNYSHLVVGMTLRKAMKKDELFSWSDVKQSK